MRSYLSLIPISSKQHRKQNALTIFCIALAVFLITGVFSMADFEGRHQFDRMAGKHGNWHILLSNVDKEEAESIKKEASIESACWYNTINFDLEKDYYLQNKKVVVIGAEKTLPDILPSLMEQGAFPSGEGEIAVTTNARDLYHLSIGDSVTIQTPEGAASYTICGFLETTSMLLNNDCIGITLCISDYNQMAKANGEPKDQVYYIRFKNTLNIRNTIAKIKETHGWDEKQVSENAAILGLLGMSSDNYIVGLYGVAGGLVLLVVVAGVLMIAGSMNTNIVERTQYFGMLRCVGANKRQVKALVRLEAVFWCVIAIPVGTILATLTANIICAVLRYGIVGEWDGMPIGTISFIGILAGAVIGVITVLLAAHTPAKKAANVSPIAAVSGNDQNGNTLKKAAKTKLLPVDVALGIHHAFSRKRNIILLTGSFALSIILFLSFSVMLEWISHALTTTKPYSPDLSVYYEGYGNSIDTDILQRLREVDGVKNVYGRMHELTDIPEVKSVCQVDLISYDDLQFDWAKDDYLDGDIELARNGKGVITVFEKSNPLCTGDKITLYGQELEIVASLSDSPFDSSDIPTILCSEQLFTQLTGVDSYALIDMQVTRKATDKTVEDIRAILNDDMRLSDRRASKKEVQSTHMAFNLLVYGFLTLVALITIFNIINSIAMSVSAHTKQYSVMHSIGMDEKQIKRMILSESLSYAVTGCITGCVIGLSLHRFFFHNIITNYWGDVWSIPVRELLIVMAVVLASSVLAARCNNK